MRLILALAAALAVAHPAAGQIRSPFDAVTDPEDRKLVPEVAAAIGSRTPDLATLDTLLTKLPRPTPLRGMVQTVRAGLLSRARSMGPSVTAAEEALRLLPDDPRPKLVASYIFTFSGSPQRAADLWLEASYAAPEIARNSDPYAMLALSGRLKEIGEQSRANRLNARLSEIGFSRNLANERSGANLARVQEAVRRADDADAVTHVTAIADPADLARLYVDRRYAMLWPRIAAWAGPDLGAQSLRFLEELRGEWSTNGDFRTAAPYARRLAAAGAFDAVIALFLPMFDRVGPGRDPGDAVFLAPIVARALDTLGRPAEATALLDTVAAAVPRTDQGNGLNIDAAYITLAAARTDWPQVVARSDAFLRKAQGLGASVNRASVVQVLSWRACALTRSGRRADGDRVAADVLLSGGTLPGPAMGYHVCTGDVAAASAHLVARLADESTREWALEEVQPTRDDPRTPLQRLLKPVSEAIRSAPDVVAAANRVGRILPAPSIPGLPKGFDPYRARPQPAPPAPGTV